MLPTFDQTVAVWNPIINTMLRSLALGGVGGEWVGRNAMVQR